MEKLRKKLIELEKSGYEFVTIQQVKSWIHEIQRENRLKRKKL